MRVKAPAAPLITMSNCGSAGSNQRGGGWVHWLSLSLLQPKKTVSISISALTWVCFFVFPQLEHSLWKLSVRLRGSIMHTNTDMQPFRHEKCVCWILKAGRQRHVDMQRACTRGRRRWRLWNTRAYVEWLYILDCALNKVTLRGIPRDLLLPVSFLTSCWIRKMVLETVQRSTDMDMRCGSGTEHGVCRRKPCVISSFTKVSWLKPGRHCALWLPWGRRPGIGMRHAGYTPDNEGRQNGVWGR